MYGSIHRSSVARSIFHYAKWLYQRRESISMCWFKYSNYGCVLLGNDVERYDLCSSRIMHLLGHAFMGYRVLCKCEHHNAEWPTHDYYEYRTRLYRLGAILLHEWYVGRTDKRLLCGFLYDYVD